MYIQTSLHQKKKPAPITKDSHGIFIDPGLIVAFNQSGNVVLGTIKELVHNEWKTARPGMNDMKWWSLKFELLIEDEEGHISKIKNPNSFIII